MPRLTVRAVITATLLVLAALNIEGTRSLVLASGFSALLTDKSSYNHGDQIRICWLIPADGTSKLTDTDPKGGSQVLRSGPDHGSGCVSGTLGGPLLGRECMTLDFETPRGSGSLQRCFMIGDTALEEHVVADHPLLTIGSVSGPVDTDIAIDGVGFQTFSYAAHGVTLFVLGPDGSQVDSDELFPSADGTLHVVLHGAQYAPGDYTVNARYTFINAISGLVSAANTQYLTDGVSFSVVE